MDRIRQHVNRETVRGYVLGVLGVFAVIMAAQPFHGDLNTVTLALLYLVVVLASAITGGIGPGILTSLIAFLTFNFFFLPPYSTFTIGAPQDIVALFVFLIVAIVTSELVSRLKQRERESRQRAAELQTLANLTSALLADVTLDTVLATVVAEVTRAFNVESTALLLPDSTATLRLRTVFPPPAANQYLLNREHAAVAAHVFTTGIAAGVGNRQRTYRPHGPVSPAAGTDATASTTDANAGGAGTMRAAVPPRGRRVLYVPVRAGNRSVAVMGVARTTGSDYSTAERRVLTTFANQAALAIDRARLTEEATRAAALAQADQLKSVLLAAVSHDLRTPLASIKASATSLLQTDVQWDAETQREFLTAIDEETDRLTRLVSNLLDLTRIQGGALKPEREPYDLEELVGQVVDRLTPLLPTHPIMVEIAPGLPTLWFDFVEIAQVLTNLIENAGKYSEAGTPITVRVWREAVQAASGEIVAVAVSDRGFGIAAEDLGQVFDTFYRVQRDTRSRRIRGTGIGLAICKGFVEAHGGTITVTSVPGEGSTFTFTLPIPPESERSMTVNTLLEADSENELPINTRVTVEA